MSPKICDNIYKFNIAWLNNFIAFCNLPEIHTPWNWKFSGAFCWDGSLGCIRCFTSKFGMYWVSWCFCHTYCSCWKFLGTCGAICRYVIFFSKKKKIVSLYSFSNISAELSIIFIWLCPVQDIEQWVSVLHAKRDISAWINGTHLALRPRIIFQNWKFNNWIQYFLSRLEYCCTSHCCPGHLMLTLKFSLF